MPDRPITFSAPEVRALLREVERPGTGKTQTRRVIKLAGRLPDFIGPLGCETDPTCWGWEMSDGYFVTVEGDEDDHAPGWRNGWHDWVGAYAPGDRLYVRENFIGPYAYEINEYPPRDWGNKAIWFPADGPVPEPNAKQFWHRARPSIQMPRWASRLTLTVTDVRVQRLQEITAIDVQAEGACELAFVPPTEADDAEARAIFRDFWNSLHGPGAWEANQWVAALTFTVRKGNIDEVPA